MTPGLQKFEIILEKLDNIFSPGDVICGRVLIDLSRIKSIRGLKMSVKGFAEVGWSQPMGASSQLISYFNKEEYFKHEFYLLGGVDNSENVEMQTGEHLFLFNFSLPNNIPSSFDHKYGKVCYTIKAVLERPWKFDHRIDILFKVKTPFDLSRYPPAMNVIDDEEYKSFCYFPFLKMGSIKVHVYVPRSGFGVGETIEARINISNYSTHFDVTKIVLQLEQIIKVIGHSTVNQLIKMYKQGHRKKSNDIVQETEKYPPFDKITEIVIGFKVPSVPSSNLVYCNIINVLYRLNIHISISNCQGSMEKSYPIVIGTKSTYQSVQDDYMDPAANQSPSP